MGYLEADGAPGWEAASSPGYGVTDWLDLRFFGACAVL